MVASEVLNSRDRVLIATLTIVVSRMDMNVPSTTTNDTLMRARSKTLPWGGAAAGEVIWGPPRAARRTSRGWGGRGGGGPGPAPAGGGARGGRGGRGGGGGRRGRRPGGAPRPRAWAMRLTAAARAGVSVSRLTR